MGFADHTRLRSHSQGSKPAVWSRSTHAVQVPVEGKVLLCVLRPPDSEALHHLLHYVQIVSRVCVHCTDNGLNGGRSLVPVEGTLTSLCVLVWRSPAHPPQDIFRVTHFCQVGIARYAVIMPLLPNV